MKRIIWLVALICLFATPTEARKQRVQPVQSSCYGFGCESSVSHGFAGPTAISHSRRQRSTPVEFSSTTMLPHPSGCPHRAFCGCGASIEVFGVIKRELMLAANWLKFPRTSPAPGMVAARRGHVFVLKRQIASGQWLVADYNSGGRRSRLHVRSLAGYSIVNPRA